MKTGAHGIIDLLLSAGIDTCFANPGTSEMHFVAALSDTPNLKPILCLFEGGATGAADGYARMAGKPAATLLHLGPGLANGLANLHNAKKAGSPILNIIGDHTTFHKQFDAPLNSDIEGTARPYSDWVRTVSSPESLATDTGEAISAATSRNGQIASLILPADLAWGAFAGPTHTIATVQPDTVSDAALARAREMLANGKRTGLILGAVALHGEGLKAMGRISAASDATLLAPYASARIERGAGLPPIDRIPFPVDAALAVLAPFEQLLLVGAEEPVAFFAYPGKPSKLIPKMTDLFQMVSPKQDILQAIDRLENLLTSASLSPPEVTHAILDAVAGRITPTILAVVVARVLREGMILVDEGVTSSHAVFDATRASPRHDLLVNVGGSIGAGLPLALGASVACPERPVLCLSGDGSASYTLQALWSMARQGLNVTTVICANHDYAILKGEMVRVGALTPDSPPNPLLELTGPELDWVALGTGYGVKSLRVTTGEDLETAIKTCLSEPGPALIEAQIEPE